MKITRLYQIPIENPKQTVGELLVLDGDKVLHKMYTIELPYLNNQKQISCIPAGEYKCVKRVSAKYGHHWHVLDVENRSLILIHSGNTHSDTLGCILPAMDLKDINNDGAEDGIRSKEAMNILRKTLPDEFTLSISWRE